MSSYRQSYQEELEYLNKTLDLLKKEIDKQSKLLSKRKSILKTSRKDMWDNSVHFSNDFDKLTEVNQYLSDLSSNTINYNNALRNVEKYKKMLKSPYFGRFDFIEEASDEREKIYIGLYNLTDPETRDIVVYDWRAPISSIFYNYESGGVSYKAPSGTVTGSVLLKRQYKIQNSKLEYFFDCNIKINDEILQEVLCKNSSVKMRSIVETIQREQDVIIRDTDNEVLIIQGVAGSGKTSIALHRIAFLLYHGLNSDISSKNIVIVSPNAVFSKYISSVLPELGEENVRQITFQNHTHKALKKKGRIETRNSCIEFLASCKSTERIRLKKQSIEFKGSRVFIEILDRLTSYYERNVLNFEDVYYNGKVVETRQRLKNLFLNNRINIPTAKRLKRIERLILDKINPLRKKKLQKIEKLVENLGGHEFEIKYFSRLLSIKQMKFFLNRLRKFTEIDYYNVYSLLFNEKGLLKKLAHGMKLPDNIEQIISTTRENLKNNFISYEDSAPLLYIKTKLEGSSLFSNIKHVVIDEAQDYSPIEYEIFNLLFKGASFTVLGDINQCIEKNNGMFIYDSIVEAFGRKKWVKFFLNKSYRSSFEINTFNQRFLVGKQDIIPFERHEAEPQIIYRENLKDMCQTIVHDAGSLLKQGYKSIAIICKNILESRKLYRAVKSSINIKLVDSSDTEIEEGIIIIPTYLAKGLEFDAVLVFNVSKSNYASKFDKKLLYIACTRALHRLQLYYTGIKSPFI